MGRSSYLPLSYSVLEYLNEFLYKSFAISSITLHKVAKSLCYRQRKAKFKQKLLAY